jgi:hydrogenase maturation factor
MDKLESTHFICRKCNISKVIEARGEVISGPTCPECRKPMRKVVLTQLELDLYPDEKRRNQKDSR